MADTKISALSAHASPADADVIPVVDLAGPTTKKTTTAQLRTALVNAAGVAAAGAMMDSDFAGALLGRLTRTGAGAYGVIRDNLAALAAPTATDDSVAGYTVGSLWIDVFNGGVTTYDPVYVCTNATASAAIWFRVPRLSDTAPLAVAAANSVGTSVIGAAREDHAHAHGVQASDGTMHAAAVASGAAGFLSGADKAKLDGVAASAAAVGAGVVAVGRANSDGASGTAARVDHVHDVGVVTPERKTASFTAASAIGEYLIDTSAGDVIVTLPVCSQRSFRFKKITEDTYKILIVPNGADTIEGKNATYFLPGSDTTERRSWDLRGSTQASALGWWLFSLSGVPAQLDLSTGGTFARALEGSYRTGAATLAWASSGERRMEDRGDGHGAMLLIEHAATNAVLYSEDFSNAAWIKTTTTVVGDAVAAPDGTVDADSLAFTASAAAEAYQEFTATSGQRASFSVWMRAAAPQTVRLVLLKRDGAEATAVSCALTTTWQRFEIAGTIGTGATTARAIIRNHTDAAARTIYAWGAQVETSATVVTASSYIRTTTATVTRPMDTLSYAVGQYPAALLTRGVSLIAIPEISSTDLPTHAAALFLFSFVSPLDWFGLTYGPASVYVLYDSVGLTLAATWSARARLFFTLRPRDGTVHTRGALTGNGVGSTGPRSIPAATLHIGIRADAGGSPWFGRLSRYWLSPEVQ